MKPLLIFLVLLSSTPILQAQEYSFKLDVEIFDIKKEKVVGEVHIKLTPLSSEVLSEVIRAINKRISEQAEPVEVKLIDMEKEE